jgi:hypothetical protein
MLSSHWTWLGIGLAVAFATPFLLADLLDLNRDLFYGVYAAVVLALFLGWARGTAYDMAAAIKRHWILAGTLGLACAAVLAVIVVRTEDATSRPDGLTLGAELVWRGVLYGATDGLLLSAFPILVVFAAFSGHGFACRWPGKIAVGAIALTASVALTAAYHAGYGDFRSDKIAKPITGDLVWSVPTLVTLNPIGAPIAHIGLHTTAVLHSYDTDTFLPPHR